MLCECVRALVSIDVTILNLTRLLLPESLCGVGFQGTMTEVSFDIHQVFPQTWLKI